MLQLNVVSLTTLTRLFLEPMVARGSGRILNVASLVAYLAGGPGWATYVASKGYVVSLTRGLAAELKGTGGIASACSAPCREPRLHQSVGSEGEAGDRRARSHR
jgi:hypothetical protein